MLRKLSPHTRIAVGLTGAMIGVLSVAQFLGFLPNEEKAAVNGRARLCEAIALSGSVLLSSGRHGRSASRVDRRRES